MIVTIDGPAGAGKSSVARALAEHLGLHFLDTGSMYRAVAFAILEAGIDPADEEAVAALLPTLDFHFDAGITHLAGRDLAGIIRTPEITRLSSFIAKQKQVRDFLVPIQREIARHHDLVTEGRDQGTIVFPRAEVKFFLTADRVERARRRLKDLIAKGADITLEAVLEAQDLRDRQDTERHDGPLARAEDAHPIDSTGKGLTEVIAQMEAIVTRCLTPSTGSPTSSPLNS
ncbi:MAG: (d)CMP kinase [Gemmataceae bacterium]|nr:(d)CMP kinase [Gemmataceae bacterium]